MLFRSSKELVDLANKNNKILFVGYSYLYHEIYHEILKQISLPTIRYLSFGWKKWGTFDSDIFYNLVSHNIALAISLFGKPIDVTVVNKQSVISSCDIVCVNMEFSRARSALINISRIAELREKIVTIVCDNTFYVWQENKLFTYDRKTMSIKLIKESKRDCIELECKSFMEAVRSGKSPVTNGLFGCEVDKVLSSIIYL